MKPDKNACLTTQTTMSESTRDRGTRGEDIAARHLLQNGYTILIKNFRDTISRGEIDIIARRGEDIVFVEVKAGCGKQFGPPASWVNPRKQQRIACAAQRYLQDHQLFDSPCRFDVIGILLDQSPPHITHIEQAFWSEY